MYERSYGNKYDGSLNVKDIAKLVRQAIKAASKSGDLPKLKASVRISRYSGGQNIDVVLKSVDAVIYNKDYQGGWNNPYDRELTSKGESTIARIQAMLSAYNHNGSDIQSDYFDVNFYSNVSYHSSVRQTERLSWSVADANEVRLDMLFSWKRRTYKEHLLAEFDADTLSVALDVYEEDGHDAMAEYLSRFNAQDDTCCPFSPTCAADV